MTKRSAIQIIKSTLAQYGAKDFEIVASKAFPGQYDINVHFSDPYDAKDFANLSPRGPAYVHEDTNTVEMPPHTAREIFNACGLGDQYTQLLDEIQQELARQESPPSNKNLLSVSARQSAPSTPMLDEATENLQHDGADKVNVLKNGKIQISFQSPKEVKNFKQTFPTILTRKPTPNNTMTLTKRQAKKLFKQAGARDDLYDDIVKEANETAKSTISPTT